MNKGPFLSDSIELVYADGGAYASGTKQERGCTICALANWLGVDYRKLWKQFRRLRKKMPHERAWRRLYHDYGLVPLQLASVLSWKEIVGKYGDCIVQSREPGGGTMRHANAIMGGKLHDWMDARHYAPQVIWIQRWRAQAPVQTYGCSEDKHAWEDHYDRLFLVPIEVALKRVKKVPCGS